MQKKSQLSLFIILAVIIILLIGVAIFLYQKGVISEINPFIFSRNAIINYVSDSIITTVDQGLFTLGVQGGYLTIPAGIKVESESPTSTLLLENKYKSVNLVVNVTNLDVLGKILKRGISDHQNFYRPFKEGLVRIGRA